MGMNTYIEINQNKFRNTLKSNTLSVIRLTGGLINAKILASILLP